jgi:hypothetical protein
MVRGTDVHRTGDGRRLDARLAVEVRSGADGVLALLDVQVSAEELMRLLPGRYVAVRLDPERRAVRVLDVSRACQVAGLVGQKRERGLLPAAVDGEVVPAVVREVRPNPDVVRAGHVLVTFVVEPGRAQAGRAFGYYLPEQLVSYAPGTKVRCVLCRDEPESTFLLPDPELVALTAYRPR